MGFIFRLMIILTLGFGGFIVYKTYFRDGTINAPNIRNEVGETLGTFDVKKVYTDLLEQSGQEPLINATINNIATNAKEYPQKKFEEVQKEWCRQLLANPSPQ